MLGSGSDYFIPSSSPYYPGNGITPAVDGVTGLPLSLNIRSQANNRVSERVAISDRILLGLDGSIDSGIWLQVYSLLEVLPKKGSIMAI